MESHNHRHDIEHSRHPESPESANHGRAVTGGLSLGLTHTQAHSTLQPHACAVPSASAVLSVSSHHADGQHSFIHFQWMDTWGQDDSHRCAAQLYASVSCFVGKDLCCWSPCPEPNTISQEHILNQGVH